MNRSQICYLIGESFTTDAIGQRVSTETRRRVFCSVDSVSRSEWDVAGAAGLAPEYRVTMFGPDYQNERTVEFNGVLYGVYRTYAVSGTDSIELYLERKGGVK